MHEASLQHLEEILRILGKRVYSIHTPEPGIFDGGVRKALGEPRGVWKRKRKSMYIGVFDTNAKNRAFLKEAITAFNVRENTDILMLSFDRDTMAILEKYAAILGIAMISLGDKNGREIGRQLALLNPTCFICYYGLGQKQDLYTLLHSRPYEALTQLSVVSQLDQLVERVIRDYLLANGVYVYTTRRTLVCCPLRSLLYFQSDLKHVGVHMLKPDIPGRPPEEAPLIYAKLSDIEEQLQRRRLLCYFVRIHKSYLANMLHIAGLDRQSHTVRLDTGEQLPVSDACYAAASERIAAFHRL